MAKIMDFPEPQQIPLPVAIIKVIVKMCRHNCTFVLQYDRSVPIAAIENVSVYSVITLMGTPYTFVKY